MLLPSFEQLMRLKFMTHSLQEVCATSIASNNGFVSTVLGQGLDYESSREYTINDDVRHIDWKVTARAQKAYVKTYRAESDNNIHIVLDLDSYMNFGTRGTSKLVQGCNVAALLMWQALFNQDKINLSLNNANLKHVLQLKPRQADIVQALYLLTDPATYIPSQTSDDMEKLIYMLENLGKQQGSSKIFYIISDFRNVDLERLKTQLSLLKSRHKVHLIAIYDIFDKSLPQVSSLPIKTLSGTKCININAKVRDSYAKLWTEYVNSLEKMAGQVNFRVHWLDTSKPWKS